MIIMDATSFIIKQGWYEEIGKIWHSVERFNKIGKHVTILDLKDKNTEDIEKIFCVRNHHVNVSIKFKDNTYYTFFVMKDSLYLDVEYKILDQKTIIVLVNLSWYTLSYSYELIGKKSTKEELFKIDEQVSN